MATANIVDSALSERTDVHKSCKSLESLLGALNDYSEAAGTTILLQKKLVKCLRETATMRTTDVIAANAMITSATVFEISVDVNTKFANFTDKEYNVLNAEIKKWFKKLTKEEKVHDDRMLTANAKIKQAGQSYEKKAKKNFNEAAEEHARYVNVISTLGPEISREKHDHALFVTQRHASTTHDAASCLSRIADAEWLRICECIRKLSPVIGKLGEWRSLCEGGWRGPVPGGLPESGDHPLDQERSILGDMERPEKIHQFSSTSHHTAVIDPKRTVARRSLPAHSSTFGTEQLRECAPHSQHSSAVGFTNTYTTASDLSKPKMLESLRPLNVERNPVFSRSLSPSPLPVSHLLVPPLCHPHSSPTTNPELPESPVSDIFNSTQSSGRLNSLTTSDGKGEDSERTNSRFETNRPPLSGHSLYNTVPFVTDSEDSVKLDGGQELGIMGDFRAKTVGQTTKKNSLVATMRNRFSQMSETTSSPQKDVIRLPSPNANSSTIGYQQTNTPTSRPRGYSSPMSRQHQSLMNDSECSELKQWRLANHLGFTEEQGAHVPVSPPEDPLHSHPQYMDDLPHQELKEKELELLQRERELEIRAQDLVLNSSLSRNGDAAYLNATSDTYRHVPLRPVERATQLQTQQPFKQLTDCTRSHQPLYSQQAYSTSQLALSSPMHSPTGVQYPLDSRSFRARLFDSKEVQYRPHIEKSRSGGWIKRLNASKSALGSESIH